MSKTTKLGIDISVASLLAAMENAGHKVFTSELSVNLIGVRNTNTRANSFNDVFCVLYMKDGEWQLQQYKCTTDPGIYYRKHPCNVDGTAVVVPGQYRGVWTFGYHQGKYPALVQNKPITVFRDDNEDELVDTDEKQVQQTGYFGINCHRASASHESKQVDKWSAGCQVFANPDDFDAFIALCRESAKHFGNTFTYTLLEQQQLKQTT